MKAYMHLIMYALSKKCVVSVWDGGEWAEERSKDYYKIVDAIKSVDESQLKIHDPDDCYMGWAMIIPSLDDDETVADCSDNKFMNEWSALYEEQLPEVLF